MRKLVFDEEIDLYYYRARYYSAELWRFISRDPIGQIDDVNLYAYVGNNPVMFSDPMGTDKKAIVTFDVIWGILRAGLWIPKAHAPSEYDWNKYEENYWPYWERVIVAAWVFWLNKAGKAENVKDFFKDSKYTQKVLEDMKRDKYHGFPKNIDDIASKNWNVQVIKWADGKEYHKLSIPWELNWKKWVYEYIKDNDWNINHRLFNIKK